MAKVAEIVLNARVDVDTLELLILEQTVKETFRAVDEVTPMLDGFAYATVEHDRRADVPSLIVYMTPHAGLTREARIVFGMTKSGIVKQLINRWHG